MKDIQIIAQINKDIDEIFNAIEVTKSLIDQRTPLEKLNNDLVLIIGSFEGKIINFLKRFRGNSLIIKKLEALKPKIEKIHTFEYFKENDNRVIEVVDDYYTTSYILKDLDIFKKRALFRKYKTYSIDILDLHIANYKEADSLKLNNTSKNITASKKLNAPIVRRFCELCNDSGLDKKDLEETVEDYCERICSKFNLEYTVNVRKYFCYKNEPKSTDKHLQKVIELILPSINIADKEVIDTYIKLK